jgi:hypothetical protein
MIESRTAIFRPVNKDMPRVHHDALEFADGTSRRSAGIREGLAALERDGRWAPAGFRFGAPILQSIHTRTPVNALEPRRL